MPNDFYTRVYSPLPEQRVSSQVLKDEFARVEAGFDEVQSDADRAIKLPEGTADQTLAMDAGARANLVLAFNAAGNITAISYGRYRGDWLTATAYLVSDYFRDPVSKNIYAVILGHGMVRCTARVHNRPGCRKGDPWRSHSAGKDDPHWW